MKWTRERPTMAGWYWLRFPGTIDEVVWVGHEDGPLKHAPGDLVGKFPRVHCIGDGLLEEVSVYHADCEWYGPIEPPACEAEAQEGGAR